MDHYSWKVTLSRITFFGLLIGCYLLMQNDLFDYVVVLGFLIIFFGCFPVSFVEVTRKELKIRKNYAWALLGWRWGLAYEHIDSLQPRVYVFEPYEDAWWFTDSIFSFIAMKSFGPKIKWTRVRITYLEDGEEKDIEVKMNAKDYVEISEKIDQPRSEATQDDESW